MHETGPFSIPAIRDFVPPKLRPWIIIAFVIVFQFSGGLYLAAVSEMVGSTALMQEDIMMAGYASMIGMGLTFAIMFRLKFRFASKTSLMTCSIALIVSNLICMQTHSIPVLVITCFFAGIFRMWATFECNSTIQLWLTPKRDLSVFFCFIYLLVQSCIQLSGLITVYTAFWAKWEYMHWLIIGLLLLVMLATLCLFRSYRSLPKLPLFGIDWLGALMWGLVLLCILFVCVYGEHYDWYQSFQIRAATVIGILILALNLWRASFIRHPFIALKTWTYRAVWFPFILYIYLYEVLRSPKLKSISGFFNGSIKEKEVSPNVISPPFKSYNDGTTFNTCSPYFFTSTQFSWYNATREAKSKAASRVISNLLSGTDAFLNNSNACVISSWINS